jgi:hypothetical protein
LDFKLKSNFSRIGSPFAKQARKDIAEKMPEERFMAILKELGVSGEW